jgi:ABC-2 type transport system ATP-binding protein
MMDEAEELCDRVAIMDHGKIIALGSPSELVKEVKMENTITVVPDKTSLKLIEQIKGMDGVKNVYTASDKDESGETIKVITDCPDDILPDVVSTIVNTGTKVLSVQLSRVTLEDVFITLTGRSLRE